jgi:hypothetical protein
MREGSKGEKRGNNERLAGEKLNANRAFSTQEDAFRFLLP